MALLFPAERNLTELVGDVRWAFVRAVQPTRMQVIGLMAVCTVLRLLDVPPLLFLASSLAWLHWLLSSRARRDQARTWGLFVMASWLTATVSCLAGGHMAASTIPSGTQLALAIAYLMLTGTRLLQIWRQSMLVGITSRQLGEQDILAALPANACAAARQWKQGDDRSQAEIASVVSLTVLWLALQRLESGRSGAGQFRA